MKGSKMVTKVLIVEDEPLIANDIEFTIEEAGFSVIGIAHSSVKALDMINNRNPDIVLLDISIKGDKNGIEIGEILQKNHGTPFIYITSYADKNTLELAKATLPYGYIVKPFKDRDIISAIEMAMFRHKNEQKPKFPSLEKLNENLTNLITQREYDVALKIWEGKSNNVISEELFLSINTIKTHTKNLFNKLNVKSRSEVTAALRKFQ
jgi:DNA-binding NarL/FixJ family response regulator